MNILNIPISICMKCNEPFNNTVDGIKCGCTRKEEMESLINDFCIEWILNEWIDREIKSMKIYKKTMWE